MRITFFAAKSYDKDSFNKIKDQYPELELEYWETELSPKTASYVQDSEAICAFVSSDVSEKTIRVLGERGVKLILMRCAGFNNVDLEAATKYGITVMRVPGYSPEAVAEHAMALAMAVNRHLHKSYMRVRENNFSLVGLTGVNFYGKTAGIVGTGKIGAAMARICHGFGMKVIGYDMYHNPDLDFVEYVMSIDPELKLNKYGKGKYLLRHAFEGDYLPHDILYREKAAFSDAVGHSMVDYLKDYAEHRYTDSEFEEKRQAYAHARPFTKESLLYREIFETYYPGQSEMVADFWMPNRAWKGCDVNDPSARVLANYGDSGK